tara:strand:- start:1077 stop:1889 length:813 start_codon:yes stop_codon:yes gene_type:complete
MSILQILRFYILSLLLLPGFFFAEAKKPVGELGNLENLASIEPKPFVVVEASGKKVKNRGQGVVVSPQGHVLSAAHIAWISTEGNYTENFRISFRGNGKNLPPGEIHLHSTTFSDRENALFKENYYKAQLLRLDNSRFLKGRDLALFKMQSNTEQQFPVMEFYSSIKPEIGIGDTFHLCHYNFPHNPADPFFLINPVEVVGVAQTASGFQYLAKGYYRVGSSGGAILKDGKLIGIQSSAYTVNAQDVGEIPLGLISFHLVWKNQIKNLLK